MSANETTPGGGRGERPTTDKPVTSAHPAEPAAAPKSPDTKNEAARSVADKPSVAKTAPPAVPPVERAGTEPVAATAPKAEPAKSAAQPPKATPAPAAPGLPAPATAAKATGSGSSVTPATTASTPADGRGARPTTDKATMSTRPAEPAAAPKSPASKTETAQSVADKPTVAKTAPPPVPPAAPSAVQPVERTRTEPIAAVAPKAEPAKSAAPSPKTAPAPVAPSLSAPDTADKADKAAGSGSGVTRATTASTPAKPTVQPPGPAGTPAPAKRAAAVAEPSAKAPPAGKGADTAEQPPVAKPAEPPKPIYVPVDKLAPDQEVNAVLSAAHGDPFAFLGMHPAWYEGPMIVRAFLPWARGGEVIDATTGEVVARLERVRDEGFWASAVQGRITWFPYRLRLGTDHGEIEVEDPYSFPPVLADSDVHLLTEGSHLRLWEKLGAHPTTVRGVGGVAFAVWAPHASRVAVVGDFNDWDGRRHAMRRRHECGVWEIFLPGVKEGALYKFEIKSSEGALLPSKSDPLAFRTEPRPGAASVVYDLGTYRWGDAAWMTRRGGFVARERPVSIYEIHLGSWRRKPEDGHRSLNFQEIADQLIGYVRDLGFTHVQLMPTMEQESETSVGYRPLAPYATSSRWGTPEQFRLLIDRCHQAEIGVLADWVPNCFSADPHGLALFDGSHLYENADPNRRHEVRGNGLVYDFGRRQVLNYLIANALFWLDQYHLDGIRIPAVETMLYLDYGRSRGEWTPNQYGGHENLEAVEFLRRMNEHVYAEHPGVFTVAQENSAWQRVSHPTFVGGLGFGFRWNTAWVRDTLRYLSRNPIHRKYYHDELLRGPGSAFHENFVLPISHEEVSIGRGSVLRKMPGDRWQRFANLRTCYALMFAHPGKKLLFMGTEFAQDREWNSDISLDWHLLDDPMHRGVQQLVRDLNTLYRTIPALYEQDCEPEGFEWIDCNDSDQSVVSFLRKSKDGKSNVAFVCNFTPVVRPQYQLGVPAGGFWQERLNTDAGVYGGSNVGNSGGMEASGQGMHGRPHSLTIVLPPFAAVLLEQKGARPN